jgi:hypothetical protein
MKNALFMSNPLVRGLRTLSAEHTRSPNASIVLREHGPPSEIAAIMSYDNTTTRQIKPRQLVVCTDRGYTQQIPTVPSLWEPLAYPLLFPHGMLGWGLAIMHLLQICSVPALDRSMVCLGSLGG